MDFSCAIFALELAKSCKIRSFLLQMKNLRKDEKAQHLQDVMIDMVMSFEFCKLRILKKTSRAQLLVALISGIWIPLLKVYMMKSQLYAMLVHNIGVYTNVFHAHLQVGNEFGD